MATAKKSTVPAAAVLAGVVLFAAGCGGSSSPGVAQLSKGKSSANASTEGGGSVPESRAAIERALLVYAKCMRSHGVPNFPDPTAGTGRFRLLPAGANPSSPANRAALAKCQKLLPGGGSPGPGAPTHPSAKELAHWLKVARCMRSHGISEFPDPRTSVPSTPGQLFPPGISEISHIEEVIFMFPRTINQQSPAFTHAAAACAFPLHNH